MAAINVFFTIRTICHLYVNEGFKAAPPDLIETRANSIYAVLLTAEIEQECDENTQNYNLLHYCYT